MESFSQWMKNNRQRLHIERYLKKFFFLWRDGIVCILHLKALISASDCICTRNFTTFLSNKSGYTYSVWEILPICLKPLTELFLRSKYDDVQLPKSVNQHSSPLNVPQGSLGESTKHSSLHKSRSCLCCPASLRPLRAPREPRRNPHLQKTNQKFWNLKKH